MVEKEASSDYSAFSSSSLVMMMVVEGGCRSGLSGDEAGKGLDATGSFIPLNSANLDIAAITYST